MGGRGEVKEGCGEGRYERLEKRGKGEGTINLPIICPKVL